MGINNESEKPEKFEPQDSEQKKIKHPKGDNKAVVKPEDEAYIREEADFGNTAKKKEISEQPVTPIKKEPKK